RAGLQRQAAARREDRECRERAVERDVVIRGLGAPRRLADVEELVRKVADPHLDGVRVGLHVQPGAAPELEAKRARCDLEAVADLLGKTATGRSPRAVVLPGDLGLLPGGSDLAQLDALSRRHRRAGGGRRRNGAGQYASEDSAAVGMTGGAAIAEAQDVLAEAHLLGKSPRSDLGGGDLMLLEEIAA